MQVFRRQICYLQFIDEKTGERRRSRQNTAGSSRLGDALPKWLYKDPDCFSNCWGAFENISLCLMLQ